MQNVSYQDGDELDDSYCKVRAILKNPRFQEIVAEIRNKPFVEGLQIAFTQLTPDALKECGVPIPDGIIFTASASQESSTSTDNAEYEPKRHIQLDATLFNGPLCFLIPIIPPLVEYP